MSYKSIDVYPCNPATTRGQSTKLSAYKDKIAYTNGRTVIVRYISVYAVAVPDASQIDRYGISRSVLVYV